MAKTIAGTLLLPNGTPLGNASIYLTAKRVEPNSIVQGVNTFFTTNSSGVYSQSVQDGWYNVAIEYLNPTTGSSSRRWNLGDILVITSAGTVTLNALLIASSPPEDPTYETFYQILADTTAQAAAAAASAAAAAASAATITPVTSATDTTPGRIWNTNYLVKNTSPTDTTAGRMMRNGDGGLNGIGGAQDLKAIATGVSFSAIPNSFVRVEGNTDAFPVAYGIPFSSVGIKATYNSQRGVYIFTSIGSSPRGGFISSSANDTYNQFAEWWTSANLVKTTSSSDATVGSMLKNGDWGIGGDGVVSNDWDAITQGGLYYNSSSAAVGIPTSSAPLGCVHIRVGATSAIQIASRTGGNQLWFRRKTASAWQPWTEVWSATNLEKVTSATDVTAGSVLTVGYGALLQTTALNHRNGTDLNSRLQFSLEQGSGEANRPAWIGGSTLHSILTLPNSPVRGMQLAFSPGTAGGENRVSIRTYDASIFSSWVELWTEQNLQKTSSDTDSTSGRMLKVGDHGVGSTSVPSSTLASNVTTGFYSAAAGDVDNPMAATQPYLNVNITSNYGAQLLFGRSSSSASASYGLKYRTKNSGVYNPWASVWDTGNTSANVQTMLGAANNAAIRAAIGVPDWETGSWTPVVAGSTVAGVGTYSNQAGRYTRVGNRVDWSCMLAWSAHTGTGNMNVNGLPFTSTTSAPNVVGTVYFDGLTVGTGKDVISLIASNVTSISLRTVDTSGGAGGVVAMDSSVAALIMSGTYFIP